MPNNLAWAIEWMSVPVINWDGEGLAAVHGTDCRILSWTYEVWNAYLISKWKCLVDSYTFGLEFKRSGLETHTWETYLCIKMIFRAMGIDEITKEECTKSRS